MLPAVKRVSQKKDFIVVQRCGQRFETGGLQLQCRENNLQKTRVGFIVGMKFSKKAVERNALKRKLREIFAIELEKIKPGLDIVISTSGRISGKEATPELKKIINELLKRGSLIKSKSKP
jgi:ribonuclease P protein component